VNSELSIYDTHAPQLIALGLSPVPIAPKTKTPGIHIGGGQYQAMEGWTTLPPVTSPQPGAGIGLRMGESLAAIDIDTDDEEIGCAVLDALFPNDANTITKIGQRGQTVFARLLPGQEVKSRKFLINGATAVELLATGKQTVLPPTIHPDTGKPYVWGNGATFFNTDIETLPLLPHDAAERIEKALAPFGYGREAELPPADEGSPFKDLNRHVQERLDDWVKELGLYGLRRKRGRFGSYEAVASWRPSSTGRPLEQRNPNLKIGRKVIYDFGVSKAYSPIDLVMAAKGLDYKAAARWLDEKTGWSKQGPEVDFDAISAEASEEDFPKEEPKKEEKKGEQKKRRFVLNAYKPLDPKNLPPRQWLYGNHYQRGNLSASVAPGGTGKSSLVLGEAIVLASGRPVLGDAPSERCRVWIHNGEEPLEELNRRIVAFCQHHKISQSELDGWLFYTSGAEFPLKVAKGYSELKLNQSLINDITHHISENKIDVFIADPLISMHSTNEKDNDRMNDVCGVFKDIGWQTNSAVEINHHMRKLPAGSAESDRTGDDSRGATAIHDAVRGMRVLNLMSSAEAGRLGLEDYKRRLHFRIDREKANYVAPGVKNENWYKFESVLLANGDDVGVVTRWDYPDASTLDHSEQAVADNELFLRLLSRLSAEGRWVNSVSGPNYAPTTFAKEPEATGVSKIRLAAAMRRLFNAKHIKNEEYHTRRGSASRIVRLRL
jgi:RecA-family ATPase